MTIPRSSLTISLAALPCLAATMLVSAPLTAQKTGGNWTTFHQWNGSSPGNSLGTAISPAGDVDGDGLADVLVGAPGASPGGLTGAGSAMIFSGASGALLFQVDGSAVGDALGTSVASAGDLNGDGLAELILGAPMASPLGLAEAGTVLVIDGATQAVLFQFDGDNAGDHLGQSVAYLGDVNGDTTPDLLYGAPHHDPAGVNDAGSVWLRSGADGSIIHHFSGPAAGDWLGHCVSSALDLTADGAADVLLGAPGASPAGMARAGSAYAYSSADGSLLLQWHGSAAGDSLGFSVSGIGDSNNDGANDLLISAPNAVTGSVIPRISGEAYVMSGADGSTLRTKQGQDWFENYGWSVAAAGDVNFDGFADYMIGAPLAQTGGVYHGSAYLIDGQSGQTLQQADGSQNFEAMGSAVAGLGDINGVGTDLASGSGLLEVAFCAQGAAPGGLANAGSVEVRGIAPLISADSDEIITSTGGTIQFFVDFPAASAGHDFRLLGSQTGLGPIFNSGVYVPLTPGDQVWRYMTEPNAPAWFTNSIGVLDANGDATVTMTVPVDEGAYFLGETFYFAAVSYIPPSTPLMSSVAVKVDFLP